MEQTFARLHNSFFRKDMDFRVKIFNLLAIAGVINCIAMVVVALVNGSGAANILLNVAAGILSLFLLVYSAKSGRYQLCYTVTIFGIFILLFVPVFLRWRLSQWMPSSSSLELCSRFICWMAKKHVLNRLA